MYWICLPKSWGLVHIENMTLRRGCQDEDAGGRYVNPRPTIFHLFIVFVKVTSTSNCTDYQSRRLHIRYRRKPPPPDQSQALTDVSPSSSEKHSLPFAHTLNGTAAAIPRLIVAILENGVRLEGDDITGLDLPVALRPFWLGSFEQSRCNIRWI